MQNLKQQKGMATVLLVLLVGISVMLITAAVAKSMVSKKEASVAAHAQTNAQLMGWAGVSAFREYVQAQGRNNISAVAALNGQTITLRNEANKKEIIAKNIRVSGCVVSNPTCTVSADISSNNKTAQAATTIQVVYELNLNNTPSIVEKMALGFTGNTDFLGTTFKAEVPNTDVIINVDGNASFLAGLQLENIRELNINSTGDVVVNCGTQKCGSTIINIHAQGRVDLSDGGNFGVVKADGVVSLSAAKPKVTRIEQIYSRSDVFISGESVVQQVRAVGNVQLTAGGYANNIIANGYVRLTTSSANTIQARKYAYISDSTVENDIRVYQYVELLANAKVNGSIYAKGEQTINTATIPIRQVAVTHSLSYVKGSIYAKPAVHLYGFGSVKSIVSPAIYGSRSIVTEPIVATTDIPQLDFTIPSVNSQAIRDEILAKMDFETKVDVTVYKNEANYIFTHNGGMSRVFLNHLYNAGTGKTYMYENNAQYEVDANGNKTYINDIGFAIGDYKYKNQEWVGAICLTVANGTCSAGAAKTDIVGFLPRLSVGRTAGFANDYDFTHTSPRKTWILRTTSAVSSIDNPVFAPGIFYFEGDVAIIGHANLKVDSMTSTFTNTILAEGDIRTEVNSPRIYSPYNLIREGDDKVALICDRTLKDIDGSPMSEQTIPKTYSSKYLVPVNLCKNASEFKYSMNRAADGTKLTVNIDGKTVDKLDLGYVALMANKNIAIGTCSRIYGDVYARSSIAGTASCGATSNKNEIVGTIATQGEAPYLANIEHRNTFASNSTIVIPKSQFTNNQNNAGGTASNGVSQVKLQWSRYK